MRQSQPARLPAVGAPACPTTVTTFAGWLILNVRQEARFACRRFKHTATVVPLMPVLGHEFAGFVADHAVPDPTPFPVGGAVDHVPAIFCGAQVGRIQSPTEAQRCRTSRASQRADWAHDFARGTFARPRGRSTFAVALRRPAFGTKYSCYAHFISPISLVG